MKITQLIIITTCIFASSLSQAQESGDSAFGIGLGLEYGGIGGRFIGYASNNFGAFVGGGYAIAGAGYNIGVQFLMNSEKRAKGFFEAMYGYNAALKIESFSGDENQVYYGPSFGGGFNLETKNDTGNFWHFSLLIPIRSSVFRRNWNAIKNDPNFETNVVLPFTITVGYNFKI